MNDKKVQIIICGEVYELIPDNYGTCENCALQMLCDVMETTEPLCCNIVIAWELQDIFGAYAHFEKKDADKQE